MPVPGGIDPVVLAKLFESQSNGILGMFNMFRWALSRFTVFEAFRYHALHFCIDYHAVVVSSSPKLEQLKKKVKLAAERLLKMDSLPSTVILASFQAR